MNLFLNFFFFRNPPWWNRRTKLERTLCFVTVTSLLMLAVMAAALAVFGYLYQRNIGTQHFLLFCAITLFILQIYLTITYARRTKIFRLFLKLNIKSSNCHRRSFKQWCTSLYKGFIYENKEHNLKFADAED